MCFVIHEGYDEGSVKKFPRSLNFFGLVDAADLLSIIEVARATTRK